MAEHTVTVSPAPVSDAEKQRWASRLISAKGDLIAGIEATDYAAALEKAVQEYYNKVVAGSMSPSLARGYAKLVARLPAVDPNELKQKLIAAVNSEEFDQAVQEAVDKWADIVSYVKGAGNAGRELADILKEYVNPDVYPFTVPGAVAATVMVGFMGLILDAAINNGYDQEQAAQLITDLADRTLRAVIERIIDPDYQLTAFSVTLNPAQMTVIISFTIEGGTGNTVQAA